MKLNVPFYKNNKSGTQCLQVSMKCVLEYYLGKKYSLAKLDQLTDRKGSYWTWTPQISPALYDLGLDVLHIAGTDMKPFLQGEKFIRQHWNEADAKVIINHTDIPVLIKSIKKIGKYKLFRKQHTTITQIKKHLSQDHIPLVLIDYNKLLNNNKPFSGHMITLTGFTKHYFYYHESGPNNPQPNKRVKTNTFKRAADLGGKDEDIIFCLRRR